MTHELIYFPFKNTFFHTIYLFMTANILNINQMHKYFIIYFYHSPNFILLFLYHSLNFILSFFYHPLNFNNSQGKWLSLGYDEVLRVF